MYTSSTAVLQSHFCCPFRKPTASLRTTLHSFSDPSVRSSTMKFGRKITYVLQSLHDSPPRSSLELVLPVLVLAQQTALYNEWRPFYLDYAGLKRILKVACTPLAPSASTINTHLTQRTGPNLLKGMERQRREILPGLLGAGVGQDL
jgi:hypothetical protein